MKKIDFKKLEYQKKAINRAELIQMIVNRALIMQIILIFVGIYTNYPFAAHFATAFFMIVLVGAIYNIVSLVAMTRK